MIFSVVFAVCSLIYAAALDNTLSGTWQGSLKIAPQAELRIVFNFTTDNDGNVSVTLDSPDQGAYGIAGEVNAFSPDSIDVSVRSLGVSFSGREKDGRMVGRFRQGGMNIGLELVPGKGDAKRPQTPVPPFPYTVKEVSFVNQADNATLSGTLTLPPGCTADTPVVLMVTGSGLQNRDEEIFGHKPFAVLADYFARKGIASLRYDDRGFGKSTGDVTAATTEDFARDAKCGMEFLRLEENFSNIGILGHSEGASVAFMLAARHRELYAAPDFIIALGAQSVRGDSILADQSATMLRLGYMPEQIVNDYLTALYKVYDLKIAGIDCQPEGIEEICADWPLSPVYISLKSNLKKIAAEKNAWLGYFIGFSPAGYISDTRCPALVIYGEKDTQVRPGLNMSVMRQLAPEADIRIYPGLNHLLQPARTGAVQEYAVIEETISPEVLGDIVKFINGTYQAAAQQ